MSVIMMFFVMHISNSHEKVAKADFIVTEEGNVIPNKMKF